MAIVAIGVGVWTFYPIGRRFTELERDLPGSYNATVKSNAILKSNDGGATCDRIVGRNADGLLPASHLHRDRSHNNSANVCWARIGVIQKLADGEQKLVVSLYYVLQCPDESRSSGTAINAPQFGTYYMVSTSPREGVFKSTDGSPAGAP